MTTTLTKKIGIGTTILTITSLILWAISRPDILVETSGNITCGYECVSYVNITSLNKTIYFYNPEATELSFSPEIKDYSFCKKDGRVTKPETYKSCGVGWRPLNLSKPFYYKYSYVLRWNKGEKNEYKVVGHKINPEDTVKWAVKSYNGEIDPVWFGEKAKTNWVSPSDWLYVKEEDNLIKTAYGNFEYSEEGISLTKDGEYLGMLKYGRVGEVKSEPTFKTNCYNNECNLTADYGNSKLTINFNKFRAKLSYDYTNTLANSVSPQFYFELETPSKVNAENNNSKRFENNMIFDYSDIASIERNKESVLDKAEFKDNKLRLETKPISLNVNEKITLDPTWTTPTAVVNYSSQSATATATEAIDGSVSATEEWDESSTDKDGDVGDWYITLDMGLNICVGGVSVWTDPNAADSPCEIDVIKVCDDIGCKGESNLLGADCSCAGTILAGCNCSVSNTAGQYVYVEGGAYETSACANFLTSDETLNIVEIYINQTDDTNCGLNRFGYMSASENVQPIYDRIFCISNITGAAGTATSMTAKIYDGGQATTPYAFALYNSSNQKVAQTVNGTGTGSFNVNWRTLTFASPPTITAQKYSLCGWADGNNDFDIVYDSSGATYVGQTENVTVWSTGEFPSTIPAPSWLQGGFKLGIFVTYTVVEEDITAPTYTNNRTNTTTPLNGTDVMINTTFTDETALSRTWCGNNFTSIWINETPVARTGLSANHTNVTLFSAGTSKVGCYQCYANDTSKNKVSTLVSCITSQAGAAPPAEVGYFCPIIDGCIIDGKPSSIIG